MGGKNDVLYCLLDVFERKLDDLSEDEKAFVDAVGRWAEEGYPCKSLDNWK
jgi:hypothetical protein